MEQHCLCKSHFPCILCPATLSWRQAAKIAGQVTSQRLNMSDFLCNDNAIEHTVCSSHKRVHINKKRFGVKVRTIRPTFSTGWAYSDTLKRAFPLRAEHSLLCRRMFASPTIWNSSVFHCSDVWEHQWIAVNMWYLLYIMCHTARRSLLFALQLFRFLPSGHFDFGVSPLNIFGKKSTKKKLGRWCWMILFQIMFPSHPMQLNSLSIHGNISLKWHTGWMSQKAAFFPGQEPLFRSDAMKQISLARSKLFLGCPKRTNEYQL